MCQFRIILLFLDSHLTATSFICYLFSSIHQHSPLTPERQKQVSGAKQNFLLSLLHPCQFLLSATKLTHVASGVMGSASCILSIWEDMGSAIVLGKFNSRLVFEDSARCGSSNSCCPIYPCFQTIRNRFRRSRHSNSILRVTIDLMGCCCFLFFLKCSACFFVAFLLLGCFGVLFFSDFPALPIASLHCHLHLPLKHHPHERQSWRRRPRTARPSSSPPNALRLVCKLTPPTITTTTKTKTKQPQQPQEQQQIHMFAAMNMYKCID